MGNKCKFWFAIASFSQPSFLRSLIYVSKSDFPRSWCKKLDIQQKNSHTIKLIQPPKITCVLLQLTGLLLITSYYLSFFTVVSPTASVSSLSLRGLPDIVEDKQILNTALYSVH